MEDVTEEDSKEFFYTANHVKNGFSKLAEQAKTGNEILYQSSRDYAETRLEDWTPELLEKALLYLSKHLLNPRHAAKILFLFEQCILEIVRYALVSDADHQTKCSCLRILVKNKPYILQYCLSYFDDKPAPWDHEEIDSKQPKKMKFPDSNVSHLEIVESCWVFLKGNLNYFKPKWDWSYFLKKYIPYKNDEVFWVACQCAAIVLGMNENAKLTLIQKYISLQQHYDFTIQYEVAKQCSHSIATETLNYDVNPSRVFMPLYKQNVTNLTVNVAGVSLCVHNPDNQMKEGCLIETKSTLYNLRRIAIGISTGKAICLVGPVGSGKTSLVSHLALLTGRSLTKDLMVVQLGEETDSKLLLGTYQCTDVPGEFVWSPGMLTKAVLEGHWLLLEDIESATSDVAAILANLLEENCITIPGFKDSVRPAPGFHLFVTHRLVSNLSILQRKDTSSTDLLERHWLRINLEPLNRDELVHIIQTKYPVLKTIATRMTSVYLLFSQGSHEEGDLSRVHSGGRLISTRDLFKWCKRAMVDFDVSSVESALKVFQDAIDIFCCSYRSPDDRLLLAGQVATCLGIIKTKAEYFCSLYKPNVNITPTTCIAGRGVLPRVDLKSGSSFKSLTEGLKYALTRGSCCLLERISVCLLLDEPALLVGETGTGKTTTLQLLAKQTGHKLIVINMNQQSDTSDLLGGYKPIDTKQVILPLRDEFENLFRSFFNVEKNLKFLENISVCISNRRWLTLLKLMITSQKAAVRRLFEKGDKEVLLKWQALGDKMGKLQTQLKQNEAAMAFAFVEGSLVQAMKEGHWVLLDEINLASSETLQCLSGLLEGSSIQLLERGDEKKVVKHPDFRIMAAMNPATDFGKKDLPPGIRNRFTELFVSEHTDRGDLGLLVSCYLPDQPSTKVDAIVSFYLAVRQYALDSLSDGSGNRPHYSLRTLCRALVVASENRCGSMVRSLYEALCLSFLTQLNRTSHELVTSLIVKAIGDKADMKGILNQPIPEPVSKNKFVPFEGYWVSRGEYKPHMSKKYILTESVKRNLCDLVRIVSLSNHPVLIQGETSVGKTSLVIYLAEASGHKVLRINNHQHTDLQEYVGSYCADAQTGSLIFKEGVLAQAMRKGDWIILDELNLAPSEVLEALNRVLDDNRELFIPETSVTIKAHPDFRIFATQNPPGTYGGRKMLSRAFRNRFVELHFGEIPSTELEQILHMRCHMPLSYCKKLVAVMSDLQLRRRGSAAFAGKQGFITLRDLFRWGERYRLASSIDHLSYYDWDQHVADEGFLVLAGRVRKQEEQQVIKEVIEKRFKRTIDLNKLFNLNENTSLVTKHILEKIVSPPLPPEFKHIVWTLNLRKLAVLVGKALEFKEPILLVGETGCGKTTISQLLAVINKQLLYSVNCHQHSESSDFLGGLRPVRDMVEKTGKLFEWVDGPLINAMKDGHMFLVDEISLADDSVLERLNSLLEPERKLLVSEKGSRDEIEIVAKDEFKFIGTMNPGGDFGKKELSPALRNRLTEIWCEPPTSEEDLIAIIDHNVRSGLMFSNEETESSSIGKILIEFVLWFSKTDFGKRISISVRDLLVWVNFINVTEGRDGLDIASSYLHGACLTLIDGIGSANTSTDNVGAIKAFKQSCIEFLLHQVKSFLDKSRMSDLNYLLCPKDLTSKLVNSNDSFGIHPFYIKKVSCGKVKNFMFDAPTTCLNVMRLLRALQVASRAVLLEGSPGVGKTSLVLALAEATGNKVTRINLSEQTDVSDLFGTDLPVEGAEGGTFAWSDGPFLHALKEGHWILLDELNLASQSVVEGLNSVLDHRGEIYIPELGRSFKVKADKTKLFACQNPQRQGGARKGLPQSFLNRFTQVFVEPLSEEDLQVIINGLYPDVKPDLLKKMVNFHNKICCESWTSPGIWEFNLRDLIRWGESMSEVVPGVAVETIYAARMHTTEDKNMILNKYHEVFGPGYPLASSLSPVLLSPSKLTIGEVSVSRLMTDDCYDSFCGKDLLLLLRDQQPALKSLALCVKMGWMAILVGKSGSGKTSLVHLLAQIVGKKLNTVPVSSAMDTTDLLGGFEQTDLWRHLERLARDVERLLKNRVKELLVSQKPLEDEAAQLYSLWHEYLVSLNEESSDHQVYELKENECKFRKRCSLLVSVLSALPESDEKQELISRLDGFTALLSKSGLQAGGVFEWVDSTLIRCVEEGEWLLLDNVNLCSGAVLDRLNSLLENGGSLSLGERGSAVHTITPHPHFRIFLTVDPKHGSISRAMRNRGVEIFMDVPNVSTMNPFDLDSMLFNLGVQFETQRSALISIHNEIAEKNIGPEQLKLHQLLQIAYISCQNWRQGFPLFESVNKACLDIYVKSRMLTSEQKNSLSNALEEVLIKHKKAFSDQRLTPIDCFWPEYKTPSTLSIQEDSHMSIAKQHGAIIYSILRNFERVGFTSCWPKEFTLKDIMDSGLVTFIDKCSSQHINLNYNILEIIPYLITSYYCCATSNDIIVRKKWLDKTVNQIIRNHPYAENQKLFDMIQHISLLLFNTLSPWKLDKEMPWDLRHITQTMQSQSLNRCWSRENKLVTMIYYTLIRDTSHADEEAEPSKNHWRLMSALEYSKAVDKGNLDEWPFQRPLVLQLSALLSSVDDIIMSALNSEEVVLPNTLCAELIYQLAWRFKLSTTARRRLFLVSKAKGVPPPVCHETLSLLELHYGWFRKHTLPTIMNLIDGCSEVKEAVHDFLQLINTINSSLDYGNVHMVPVARKFRKLLLLPLPKSSTYQCEMSKKIHSAEYDLDIWRSSSKQIQKINFLASANGLNSRSKMIQSAILVHENREHSLLDVLISEVETSIKVVSQAEKIQCSLNETTGIKLWPLLELICIKLNTAIRKTVLSGRRSSLDLKLIEALNSWYEATGSISPSTAAIVKSSLHQTTPADYQINVELLYYLTDYMNISPSLAFPLDLINWEDTSNTENDAYTVLESKAVYLSHFPLMSLFLSKLLTGVSSEQDTPSFALKAHKNLTRMFSIIKLLLWRNLPVVYSNPLSNSLNEIECIENTFKTLMEKLKKAFNSKNKDSILSNEPMEILSGILETLTRMSEARGSYLPEFQKIKAEVGLKKSLSNLSKLLEQMKTSSNATDEWLLIGQAWAHIGWIHLLLFSLLELVDPVKKKAIKVQYVSEEVSELRKLLCAEELTKLVIGAPPSWPLRKEHENRISQLEAKYKDFEKAVSVRPSPSLYSDIIKFILHITTTIISEEMFGERLSTLVNLESSNKSREENEMIFAETRSWLTSIRRISEKLYKEYYVVYPDIVCPVLMAISQISYGLKLVWTCAEKRMLQKLHRGKYSVHNVLESLCMFPVNGLKSSIDLLECCSSAEIVTLLNKLSEDSVVPHRLQDNKIKLIKICMRVIKGVSQTYAMKHATNTFFLMLDHVVQCWHQIQEQEKIKKAQEDSIYINRMKLTEEEEFEREKKELFPTFRDKDFGDLEEADSLEGIGKPQDEPTKDDPLKLSADEIAEICLLHSEIVRGAASAHWLPSPTLSQDSPLYLLKDRVVVFSALLQKHYMSADEALDTCSIPALLLAAGLPANQPNSLLSKQKHYNFYRDSNISESKQCIPLMNAILKRVNELLVEWPDHPTLNQIIVIIDRILGFSMGSPLSRFLTGLELLLTKLHHWEENAHAGVSLSQHSASLTQQIIQWRKLELSAWKGALQSSSMRVEASARKWWFHIYSLVTSFARNTSSESLDNEREELVKSLETFMETSSLGEFFVRLELLLTFHYHTLLLPQSTRRDILVAALWNIYSFYKLFTTTVSKVIGDLTSPIEKKIKDFVKIARWNDINYWSVKSAVDKTHHTLLRHIKDYEKILHEPARGAMVKMDLHKSGSKLNLLRIKPATYLTTCVIPESYSDRENEETLFSKLDFLLRKSQSVSTQTMLKCCYPDLLSKFEMLIDDIEETGKLIYEFDIDMSLPKDKRKSAVKSLLQRKRKSISDLFKILSQIGLSYRSGLILFEQKNIDFTKLLPLDIRSTLDLVDSRKSDKDWLNCWKGSELFFYSTVAKLATLKIALEKPHKDLGPQFIERIKGFSSHSNSLLYQLKDELCKTTVSLSAVRCQLVQLLKIGPQDYGIIESNFFFNKKILKEVSEDIRSSLNEFIILLDACPEQEIGLNDNQPVPIILPDCSKLGMVAALKNDPVWESTRAKVDSVINTVGSILKQISVIEKHKSFMGSIDNSGKLNIDTITCLKDFQTIENGFDSLRKVYSNLVELEKLFEQSVADKVLTNPLTACLTYVKSSIDDALQSHHDIDYPLELEFSDFNQLFSNVPSQVKEKCEVLLNKSLCIIQSVYKSHVPDKTAVADTEVVPSSAEPTEVEEGSEIILDGHLKEKILEKLYSDINSLRIHEVSQDIADLCDIFSEVNDLKERRACQGLLYHFHPILDQLVCIYHYFVIQLTAALKALGKFSASLISVFTEFAKNGYKIPEELMDGEEEGEGETQQKGGLGLGEGEGEKDVSEQIESEDQLEDARRPGDYGNDEDKDCKEEEKGIEMSENFEGKLQDIDKPEGEEEEEKSDDEDKKEEDLDKEMGETEKGADNLDKQIWGSDSEEEGEEEDELPKDEKGNKGEQQSEKELGAREEEEKDEVGEKEGKKKEPKEKEINEMDEPEVDDDQIDPYHGKQQPSPEVEPLELEDDDMALDDDDDKGSDDEGDKENPFDIDTMKKKIEEEKGEEKEPEEKEEGAKNDAEDEEGKGDEDDEPTPELRKPELDESDKEQDDEVEEGSKDDDGKGDVEEEEVEDKTGHEESEGADETPSQVEAERSDKQQGSSDQVKSSEDMDVDANISPEETKAEGKEQSGSGKAENVDVDSGGHKGETGKRKNIGNREQEEKKQKPGQSEIERSLGEVNEPVKKKLKTMGIQKESPNEKEEEREGDEEKMEEDTDADLYQHIHEAKEGQHDAQTVDAATQEQAEKQPTIGKEDEETVEISDEDEIINVDEDVDIEVDVDTAPEQESSQLKDAEALKEKDKKKGEGGGPLEEAKVEVEGEYVQTLTVARGAESSFHTVMSETSHEAMTEAELFALRQQLQQQLDSWTEPPRKEEASAAWEKVCNLTSSLAQQLSEELRLILEPTTASNLRGDFRTGKRINMRKVIPYIASQFRKDKIWLRRTKPSKREYQIILAIDDSSSMADNNSKELAFESLAVVSKALNLIEAGELGVISFGDTIRFLHKLGDPFTENSGARLMQEFRFDEHRTKVGAAVEAALGLISHRGPDSAQLLVIVSDGRGVMSEGEALVRRAIRKAIHARLFIIFILIDNPSSKDSILDIRLPMFSGGKLVEIKSYLDSFPFPFYLILRDITSLPSVLSDALRQWFELVTDIQ